MSREFLDKKKSISEDIEMNQNTISPIERKINAVTTLLEWADRFNFNRINNILSDLKNIDSFERQVIKHWKAWEKITPLLEKYIRKNQCEKFELFWIKFLSLYIWDSNLTLQVEERLSCYDEKSNNITYADEPEYALMLSDFAIDLHDTTFNDYFLKKWNRQADWVKYFIKYNDEYAHYSVLEENFYKKYLTLKEYAVVCEQLWIDISYMENTIEDTFCFFEAKIAEWHVILESNGKDISLDSCDKVLKEAYIFGYIVEKLWSTADKNKLSKFLEKIDEFIVNNYDNYYTHFEHTPWYKVSKERIYSTYSKIFLLLDKEFSQYNDNLDEIEEPLYYFLENFDNKILIHVEQWWKKRVIECTIWDTAKQIFFSRDELSVKNIAVDDIKITTLINQWDFFDFLLSKEKIHNSLDQNAWLHVLEWYDLPPSFSYLAVFNNNDKTVWTILLPQKLLYETLNRSYTISDSKNIFTNDLNVLLEEEIADLYALWEREFFLDIYEHWDENWFLFEKNMNSQTLISELNRKFPWSHFIINTVACFGWWLISSFQKYKKNNSLDISLDIFTQSSWDQSTLVAEYQNDLLWKKWLGTAISNKLFLELYEWRSRWEAFKNSDIYSENSDLADWEAIISRPWWYTYISKTGCK